MATKLDDIVKSINKKYSSTVLDLNHRFEKCERIPFSSPMLNYMTYGGIPRGKLIEFFGKEHSGKTSLALDIIGQFQIIEKKRKALFVDVECSFDVEWASKFFVNVENLLFYQPEQQSAEEIFNDVSALIDTGDIGLIVIDSIPTLVPKSDVSKKYTDSQKVGGITIPLRRFLRENLTKLKLNNCSLIMINQNIAVVSSMFPAETQPGGGAPKYYSSLRLNFKMGTDFFDEDGKSAGTEVRVEV